jgi:hypothetical protein
MNKVTIISFTMLLAMVISACGAQAAAEPTISADQIQQTAAAAASTIVAETQAAIPTNTPIPPTDTPTATPLPTETPLPAPTLDALAIPTFTTVPQSSGNSDPCSRHLNLNGAGPTHSTRIKNLTGGKIKLALTLTSPNAFGECGWHPSPPDSGVIGLPSGNWYAYAWITLKNGKQTTVSTAFFVQPAQFDQQELCIRENKIIYGASC